MVEPVICAGCALLCDDTTAELSEEPPRLLPPCPVGEQWLAARTARDPATPSATIDGAPAGTESALTRAAELLREARRPLVHGFGETTTEDARAAVALADRLGAIVTGGPVSRPWPGAPALPLRGASSATLGEIRDRARLVVVWREDVESTHPRLLDRLGFGAGARTSRLEDARTLVVVDDRDTDTAQRADVRCSWPADDDLEALRWLSARRRGTDGGHAPPADDLGERLDAATHSAIVYGSGLTAGAGGERRALALHDLVRALNADHRAVALALPDAPGRRGAEDVLAWQTGYPGLVDLASGYPEPVAPGEDIVAREGIDIALTIGGGAGPPLAGVTEIALSSLPVDGVAVSLRTAAPGLETAGTAHRLDGVPLTLRAPRGTDAPTTAALLARLGEELAS